MADIRNRGRFERDLARILGRVSQRRLNELVKLLGNPPDATNVPDSWWESLDAEMRAALTSIVRDIYLQQAEGITSGVGIGIDWALVNRDAADWARQYTFDLVKEIRKNTQSAITAQLQGLLQNVVGTGIEQSLPLRDIRAALAPTFGPVRSDMIATTEITRAAAQGELAAVNQLREGGVDMRPKWFTREDEKVCPICGGLSDVVGDEHNQFKHRRTGRMFDMPPAHPRCRCFVNWEVVRG